MSNSEEDSTIVLIVAAATEVESPLCTHKRLIHFLFAVYRQLPGCRLPYSTPCSFVTILCPNARKGTFRAVWNPFTHHSGNSAMIETSKHSDIYAVMKLNYTAPPKTSWWTGDWFQSLLQLIGFAASVAPDPAKEIPVPMDEDEVDDPWIYGRYDGP